MTWKRAHCSPYLLMVLLGLLLSACSTAAPSFTAETPQPRTTRLGELTPYLSPSASNPSHTPASATQTPPPAPTPTPRTHTVARGEDMGAIAWKYQVKLEDLMAANPDVMPNLMSVGTVLMIPASAAQPNADSAADALPASPTAIPVESGELSCHEMADGGVWCFLPIRNQQNFTLDSVTATIRLSGSQPGQVLSQPAFSLIDTLPAGAVLPLVAYFAPEQTAGLIPPYQYSSEIHSAFPNPRDGRYLPVRLEGQEIDLSEHGLAAAVSVRAVLESESGKAQRLWIAAVAYNPKGDVVGVRRWENETSRPLESGLPMEVSFNIYSTAGAIERIELFAEARP